MNMRVALSWFYREACLAAPGGQRDVDAWLAGEELPSVVEERAGRLTLLASAGGEIHEVG